MAFAALVGWAASTLAAHALAAPSAPVALCGQGALPAYPAAEGAPPAVASWSRAKAASATSPLPEAQPDCTGLRSRDFVLLVGVAGRWRSEASAETLLARVAAISQLKGLMYWSNTDRRREVLIVDAAALDSLEGLRRRADFSVAEISRGQPLYFAQRDNRTSGEVVYRLQAQGVSAQGWSVRLENVSAAKRYVLTLLAPGDLQSVITLQSLGPGLWGYRSLTGIRTLGLGPAERYRAAYISRALASFEHFSGVAAPAPAASTRSGLGD